MLIPFNPLKVVQATSVLLKTEGSRRMSRLRILKLLYISDRESLKERARPITGDRVAAMDNGPVLSNTYNLIKGADSTSPLWEKYLRSEGRDVLLIDDPGVGKLSRFEIEKLQTVANHFQNSNDWDIAEYTHEFPEWIKNKPDKGSSNQIPLDHILEAVGLLDKKDALLANAKAEFAAERFFASAVRHELRGHVSNSGS